MCRKIQSINNYLSMLAEEDSWSILCNLQRGLKKEFLLVEKEQQEKIKLKREIEDSIRSYHALSIQIKDPKAELLKDEGFGNCYNFIKDVIIGISTNIALGMKIIYLAEEQSTLVNLIIHNFYQNMQTNDPYAKDVTKLIHRLMSQLFQQSESITKQHKRRIIEAWKFYMEKVDHEHYFQQISNRTLRQLLKEEKKGVDRSSIKSKDDEDNDPYQYSWEVKNKDQLLQQFIHTIQKEAHLCPASIKVPLKAAYQTKTADEQTRISRTWQLISSFYLHPFKAVCANPALPTHLKERILNFVDELITKSKFFSELSHHNLDDNKLLNSNTYASIERICSSLVQVNEQRYKANFLVQQQIVNPADIQIKIVGAPLNLIQLHELLILLNTHKEVFAKVNDRIIHRTQRIFEMSPNLQILKREKPSLQYVSIGELRYEQSISSDYYKNYTNTYRSETLKQILKQVLVELQSLGDYRTSKHIIFSQIFSSIVQSNTEAKGRSNLSAQLEMKVKYLVFLLKTKDKEEHQIMKEMNQQLTHRNSVNIKLFEDTKFSLLKVYCNLRNLKLQLKGRQDSERKSKLKLLLLDKIESDRLDYCVSSRASRNKSLGDQFHDQYRYRMSSADQILISPLQSCIHKDNPFTGTQSHANTIARFLKIFSRLPQVKYFIGNPSFMHSKNQPQLYTYCNQNKIRQAFKQFTYHLIDRFKLEHQEKTMIQSILYRRLCELLLGKGDNPHPFPKDRHLTDKIQALSLVKQGREVQSPRKNTESNRKRRGSISFDETPIKSTQNFHKGEGLLNQQLIAIGSRHILSLNVVTSPLQKVRKVKELYQIYRAVIDKNDPKAQQTIETLIMNSIIAAKLPNLISTLSYLYMFLPEDKLISSEGMVLKQLERAVLKIFQAQTQYCQLQRSRVFDC